MADLLDKIKALIEKIVKVLKDLLAKITGKEPAADEETTGA